MATLANNFHDQAVKRPTAIAVRDGDQCFSYQQLDERSNRLAHYLLSEGIRPGDRIGIAIDRSLDLPVAVLAVLKVGAAYVPFDPGYPEPRLRMMATDSQANLLLVSPQYAELFSGCNNVQTIDTINDVLVDCPIDAVDVDIDIDALAYLIYTSGSTGRPKGVAMPQRALLNLIDWQLQQPGMDRPARTLQFTPLSFDVHFQEFFSTWCSGGELVLIDDAHRRDAISLLKFLNRYDIEHLFLPFVALQHLAEVAISYGPLPTRLKHIITAGEQLQVNRYIIAFFSSLRSCVLHNHYGPSETHVVTSYTLSDEPANWRTLPPIGTPIANTRVYIVDEHLHSLPRGESGEICVAGECLAQGYWQQPELTAERFVTHPHTGERLYRTGDMGVEQPDGNIDYLGRIDGQVKIRGYRIETGEIEAALATHPMVKNCAVLAAGQSATDKKLLAYLVLGAREEHAATLMQSLRNEQLVQWQQVWDGTYSLEPSVDPEFDISGWNSSYTGEPLAAADMRCWVEGTVHRIRALNPARVLEIGCGTGLILYGLAPHCDYYHGTDFSPIAIKRLEHHLTERPQRWSQCCVSVMTADEMTTLADKAFDTIVLNSVTQHFPSVDYLFTVIQSACQLLQQGGRIFIGDVTSKLSREAFFAELELHKAQPSTALQALRANLEKSLGEERELVISPELFYRLPKLFPLISSVEVQLKPGRYNNELSRFRYDVVLHVAGSPPVVSSADIEWLPWQSEIGADSLPDFFSRYLQRQQPEIVGVASVPNQRVSEAFANALLLEDESLLQLSDIQALSSNKKVLCYDPQDFRDLESSLSYVFTISISSHGHCFDVVARRLNSEGKPVVADFQYTCAISEQPMSSLASEPLNAAIMPGVVAQLREQLAGQLPEYMLPQRYLLLSRLPMTPSGKLNRRALPQPSNERPVLKQEYVPAKSETEKTLASIWESALELENVGVNDNFFDLGGNSILSINVGMQIKLQMEREIAVVTLFQYPTIRALAGYFDGDDDSVDVRELARTRAKKQKKAFANRRPMRNR